MSGRRARLAAAALAAALLPGVPWALAEGPRVVAIGDVHGAYDELRSILRASGLTDAEDRWAGGDAVWVQTGDLLDRGARVREVMDLVMRLQREAAAAGGRVVALAGNHEQMNLIASYRDVGEAAYAEFADADSEGRRAEAWERWRAWAAATSGDDPAELDDDARDRWLEEHPPGRLEYAAALGADGAYGAWLRERPVAAVVGSTLFMHAGLAPSRAETDLEAINRAHFDVVAAWDADRERLVETGLALEWFDLDAFRAAAEGALHAAGEGEEQPVEPTPQTRAAAAAAQTLDALRDHLVEDSVLWYRGWARLPEAELAELIDAVGRAHGVERAVAAHSPLRSGRIAVRDDGRVFLIDTGMLTEVYDGRASALEIVDGGVRAIYVDGDEVLVEAAAAAGSLQAPARKARWLGPDGEPLPFDTDEQVLDFLASAAVTSVEDIPVGVTKPRRLELERGGVRARAAFRYLHEEGQRVRLSSGETHMFFLDSFRNEVAAYELSRMLGLDSVPPVVLREVRGDEGSVQLWVEGVETQSSRLESGARPSSLERVAMARQSHDMGVFDNLINNIDRNAGNMLWGPGGRLWLIDHTRAFARDRQLPAPQNATKCSRALWEGLRALDPEAVDERLAPYLGTHERKALLRRREALIELLEKRIAEEGEASVLFDSYVPGGAPAG